MNESARKKPSLSDFAISEAAETPTTGQSLPSAGKTTRSRGKGERVAIAVRLERDDWRRLHEYALHQGKSLQVIIIEGIQAHMKAQGVRPISGN
jgi:hypothetical protein